MPEDKFKRHTAFKLRIGDLLIAKPVFNEEKFIFLELGSKQISRVNLVGNVIEKYDSQGEKQYSFITIDDGSGQIKLKSFGNETEKLKDIFQGQTILVFGILKNWNNETYIYPEIIKEIDSKYLLVRKLEIEKERSKDSNPLPKQEIIAVKDRILGSIKNSEEDGGIELDKIIMDLRDISPEIINQEIQKFIEEGIVFEPRPGKVRYLG